jgi:hypothetical protein
MKAKFMVWSLIFSATTLLVVGGVAFADQDSAMPGQGSEYRVLEEQGLEINPVANSSGNNGTVPHIDSIPPDGVLLIPESNADVVGMYDPFDGTFLGNLISGGGLFSTPINAIQGPDNNIYVSDQVADAIFVYDTSGTYLYTYADASDGLDNIRGIDFRNDTLFVTTIHTYVARFAGPHNRIADFFSGAGAFDIMFLEDGRSLLTSHASPNGVWLYDVDGSFVSSVLAVSFPEQVQFDELEPGGFLNAGFTSDNITDFDLDGTIYQTTPFDNNRAAYRLGNGNILATNSGGVYELDPGSGNIIQQENSGSGRFIELYKPVVTGDPGALMGTVTDLQMNSIEGAIVAIGYRRDTTDASGAYFFDLYPNTYTAIASAEYHNSVTIEDIVIAENETTTVDFALPTPLIDVDISPVQLEVDSGEVVTVTRNVANTGDGELEFDVEVNIGDFVFSVNQNGGEIVANNMDPQGETDISPFTYNGGELPVLDDFMDSVFVADLGFLNDTQLLGMEFDGTNFWVTGGNSGSDPNLLYKLDAQGNLVEQYNQQGTTIWGWRDLAFDGEFLYGSDDGIIDQIDPTTGNITGVTFSGPENPNRALAYDPVSDHFFTADFDSPIYEFDRSGTVINSWTNSKAVYGLAYDNISADGPWLWAFSQDGSPLMQISQFNPTSGTYTGVSWQCALPTGFTDGTAGGACLTTNWDPSIAALFVLGQGSPNDFIYGYEIAPFSRWLIVDPMSGVLQPAENVDLDVTIDFTVPNINYDSCYRATIVVNNNTPDAPEIQVEVNCQTGIDDDSGLPKSFALSQNYPNPFNASTNIDFALPQRSDVKVEVFNLLGQKTATLYEGSLPAGSHTITWNASEVASGIYYYKLTAGDYSSIRMMTLLK